MTLTRTIAELQALLQERASRGLSIGLVPTMGALHEGHLSLIRRSLEENGATVVSIFLNPTQFNDKKDLERYPSDLEKDLRLLGALAGDLIAFAPSVSEMYPQPDTRLFSYPPTDTVMEGHFRPGHFNGVCQIVSKLLTLTMPTRAYFGEKDYQQVAVIRRMVSHLALNVAIVACPTVRDEGGLALSSRNALLTPEELCTARAIHAALAQSRKLTATHTPRQTEQAVTASLNAVPGLSVQYFSIVDGDTLAPVPDWHASSSIVGCIAVWCGALPVRLIDHISYTPHHSEKP